MIPRRAAGDRIPAKICGLTTVEDATASVALGARYLGVILAGGPRLVTPARAGEIAAAAGQVPVIGVFGPQGEQEILGICRQAGLAGAQLHGDPDPHLIEPLLAAGLPVLPVVKLGGPADLRALDALRDLPCPVLIEPRVPGRLGGAGVALPLDLAREARERLRDGVMVLAGGLTPESVAGAVRAVAPDAVDVSSGVEQIPGVKDHERVARFLEVLGWP